MLLLAINSSGKMKDSQNNIGPNGLEKEYDKEANEGAINSTTQEIFYNQTTKDLEQATLTLRYCDEINAMPREETIIKSMIASLRIKKYNSSNEELTLNAAQWKDTTNVLARLFPPQDKNFRAFFTNSLENATHFNEFETILSDSEMGPNYIKNADERITGRLINDLIFDEKLGSISTPLMKVLNSSLMKKTKSSIVKELLTKATQEYIDFADLDGNTAASMAIKDQKSDLAKMIIEKTSVSFLFAINARGESAISLACRREENDLIEMIIEKYNNDLLEEEQKSIWNNNNYYYILVSLIGLIEEDNACFQKLEKAINNLFIWFSETPPMKEEFLSETKYNHAYNNFIQNKNDFWHLIRDWSNQQEQNEESLNYASHLDQIN